MNPLKNSRSGRHRDRFRKAHMAAELVKGTLQGHSLGVETVDVDDTPEEFSFQQFTRVPSPQDSHVSRYHPTDLVAVCPPVRPNYKKSVPGVRAYPIPPVIVIPPKQVPVQAAPGGLATPMNSWFAPGVTLPGTVPAMPATAYAPPPPIMARVQELPPMRAPSSPPAGAIQVPGMRSAPLQAMLQGLGFVGPRGGGGLGALGLSILSSNKQPPPPSSGQTYASAAKAGGGPTIIGAAGSSARGGYITAGARAGSFVFSSTPSTAPNITRSSVTSIGPVTRPSSGVSSNMPTKSGGGSTNVIGITGSFFANPPLNSPATSAINPGAGASNTITGPGLTSGITGSSPAQQAQGASQPVPPIVPVCQYGVGADGITCLPPPTIPVSTIAPNLVNATQCAYGADAYGNCLPASGNGSNNVSSDNGGGGSVDTSGGAVMPSQCPNGSDTNGNCCANGVDANGDCIVSMPSPVDATVLASQPNALFTVMGRPVGLKDIALVGAGGLVLYLLARR